MNGSTDSSLAFDRQKDQELMGLIDRALNQSNFSYLLSCRFFSQPWLGAKFIMLSIIGTSIAVIGVAGNVMTVIVFSQPVLRTPHTIHLIALAFYDTCLLVCAILLYSMEHVSEFTNNLPLYLAWVHYLKYVFGVGHLTQTGSVYTTLAVTLERYYVLVYPGSRTLSKGQATVLSLIAVATFSIALNMTRFFEIDIYRQNCSGFASVYPIPSALLLNSNYQFFFSFWISSLTMVLIPFMVLLVFNILIIRAISQVNSREFRIREATIILVVIVIWFLLCNSWGFVLTTLERTVGERKLAQFHPKFYNFSRETINFLAIVNSSANFFIYWCFGKEFRKEMIRFYSRCTLGLKRSYKFSVALSNDSSLVPSAAATSDQRRSSLYRQQKCQLAYLRGTLRARNRRKSARRSLSSQLSTPLTTMSPTTSSLQNARKGCSQDTISDSALRQKWSSVTLTKQLDISDENRMILNDFEY